MSDNSQIIEQMLKQREAFFKDFYQKKKESDEATIWKNIRKMLQATKDDMKKITWKNMFNFSQIFTINHGGKKVNIFQFIENEQKKAATLALNPIVIKKEEQNFKTYFPKKLKNFVPLKKTGVRA
jgi:hypothetical protein